MDINNKVMVDAALSAMKWLDQMVESLSERDLDLAYDPFVRLHGYDLRSIKNNDHLKYAGWTIAEERLLVIRYVEITPHDIPYEVELSYDIHELKLTDND